MTISTSKFRKAHAAGRPQRSVWAQPLGLIGGLLLVGFVLIAVFAPAIAPFDPNAQDFARLAPPSAQNLFGTDQLGRDI